MNNEANAKRKTIKGIDDDIFREAKAMAARKGETIGTYITTALAYRNIEVGASKNQDKAS